jgi:hypothetical protein
VRKLTDRQVAVLAAIERLGWPTLDGLRHELHALPPSEINRVVAALVIRGLIREAGKPLRLVAVPRDGRPGRLDSVPAGD